MTLRMLLFLLVNMAAFAQDPVAIVRKSVELAQSNWERRRDYTWTARRTERHFDTKGHVQTTRTEAWETVILYGEPHRKFVERDGKPLSAADQRKEQQKLDKEVAKLRDESPRQRERRLAEQEKTRRKDREFLREIPDIYNLRLEGVEKIDGRPVWVIAATPKSGYRPKALSGNNISNHSLTGAAQKLIQSRACQQAVWRIG